MVCEADATMNTTELVSHETGLDVLERLSPRPTPASLTPLLDGEVKLESREVIQVSGDFRTTDNTG